MEIAAHGANESTAGMNPVRIIALLAIALWAAAGVAADTNHNFGVWETEVRTYELSDATNPPPKGAVLFVGSSGIRLWKTLARDFPNTAVINRGIGGCEIVDCIHFADRILFPYEPRQIVFRCGGNDIAKGKSPEAVAEDFKKFVRIVREKLPNTEIVFISWNPTVLRWENAPREEQFNRLVKEFIEATPGLKYVETADMMLDHEGKPRADLLVEDKIHFNAEGYRLLAERVRPFVSGSGVPAEHR